MSKQLAISSSFCIFALAAMAVFHMPQYDRPQHDTRYGIGELEVLQAEASAFDLTTPSVFSN